MADCKFENREENGGRLIPKEASKRPFNKYSGNKNFAKKPYQKVLLLSHEEYMYGDEDGEKREVVGTAAIATTSSSPTSLFDSPNENKIVKHCCLMARGITVTKSSPPLSIY